MGRAGRTGLYPLPVPIASWRGTANGSELGVGMENRATGSSASLDTRESPQQAEPWEAAAFWPALYWKGGGPSLTVHQCPPQTDKTHRPRHDATSIAIACPHPHSVPQVWGTASPPTGPSGSKGHIAPTPISDPISIFAHLHALSQLRRRDNFLRAIFSPPSN